MDKRKAQESRIVSKKAMAVQGRKAAVVTLSDAMKGLSI
jgi:hypothetical protein